MDISMRDCPDIKAFGRILVSGKSRIGIEETIQWSADHLEENQDLLIDRLSDSLINSIEDCRSKISSINGSFSVFVHNPFGKNACAFFDDLPTAKISSRVIQDSGLAVEKIEVIAGSFSKSLLKAISIFEAGDTGFFALASLFKYTAQDHDRSICIGIGSLFFSREILEVASYASLIIENDKGHLIPIACAANPEAVDARNDGIPIDRYQHFLFAPVVGMIGTILELRNRSRFSILHNNIFDENIEKDFFGMQICPWFSSLYEGKRSRVFSLTGEKQITIEENEEIVKRNSENFSKFDYSLLVVPINGSEHGIKTISENISMLSEGRDMDEIAKQSLHFAGDLDNEKNILVVLGESRQELISELERAKSGIIAALENRKDWQTPKGSFFTPSPLGPKEKIAFVYPGAFGMYVGMGSEVFFLFPELYEKLQTITEDPASSINDALIYPRKVESAELEDHQNQLDRNPIKMITSGVCFSFLYTEMLRDIFKVRPDAAFGYSLGEISMMFAMGIWKQADAMRTSLEVSPVFHSRVSGPQMAIREYWKMQPQEKGTGSSIWANYVLMSSPEKVNQAISKENQVYLTHINAPRQVVIGGQKDACQRVADTVNCMRLRAPYNHAIHCDPVASEYKEFFWLHDWPVENLEAIPVYSAADYAPLEKDSNAIAHSFAKMLTNPIDFPRLVNLAYNDGARIFIELGAGSNCTKWIDAALKGKPHAAFSVNQNNVPDHVAILRLLARLISHKVSLCLDPLGSS